MYYNDEASVSLISCNNGFPIGNYPLLLTMIELWLNKNVKLIKYFKP